MKQLRKKEAKNFLKDIPTRTQEISLLLENIQYARNVAASFRTADAAGIEKLYLTGISHHPPFGRELKKVSRKKESVVRWEYYKKTHNAIRELKEQGYFLVALELTDEAVSIYQLAQMLRRKQKVCILAGSEVYGITKKLLSQCDLSTYIPMWGKGTSLNIAISVGVALYSI